MGSENNDVIILYIHNMKDHAIYCPRLPDGYTCDVAIGDDREFITFTIGKK